MTNFPNQPYFAPRSGPSFYGESKKSWWESTAPSLEQLLRDTATQADIEHVISVIDELEAEGKQLLPAYSNHIVKTWLNFQSKMIDLAGPKMPT